MGARVESSTSASTNSAASLAINKPAGAQQGDIVLIIPASSTGAVSLTAPSGFTTGFDGALGGATLDAFWRVLDGSEGASFTIGTSGGSAPIYAGALLLKRALRSAPINASAENRYSDATTDVVAPSVTATRSGLLVTAFARSGGASGGTQPAGMTEHVDIGTSGTLSLLISSVAVGVGATGTKTATGMAGTANNKNGLSLVIASVLGGGWGAIPI